MWTQWTQIVEAVGCPMTFCLKSRFACSGLVQRSKEDIVARDEAPGKVYAIGTCGCTIIWYSSLSSQISSYPRACTYLVSSYVPHPTWLLYGVYGVVAVSVSKAVCHVTMYSASVPKKKVWRVLVFLHFPSSRKLGSNKSQVPSPKFLQDQVCAVPISLHLRRCNNNKHGFSCSHHVLICCLQVHVQPSPTAGAHQTTRSHHP